MLCKDDSNVVDDNAVMTDGTKGDELSMIHDASLCEVFWIDHNSNTSDIDCKGRVSTVIVIKLITD